jgi:hypothetical protein
LAFLRAFIDDSAAQAGDRRLFLAGYLARADVWAHFSESWHQELNAWPSIDYFKGSEANHLTGQFDYKKGWDQALRDAKAAGLAAIINHYQPFSFEFSLNRQLFEDELKPVSPYGLGRPHLHLSFCVVSGLARYAAQEGITTPIEFIFDEQSGVDTDVAMFFSELKKALPIEAQKLIEGTPFFKSDRDKRYMPLQAADMLAWHLRREHETGSVLPLTRHLVNKSGHLVQKIPDEIVRAWADHHSKQPGIDRVKTKGQWRNTKREIQRLIDAGIDPSRVTRPGVYYPDDSTLIGRTLDRLRRVFQRR